MIPLNGFVRKALQENQHFPIDRLKPQTLKPQTYNRANFNVSTAVGANKGAGLSPAPPSFLTGNGHIVKTRLFLTILSTCIFWAASSVAWAVPIHVETGGYTGQYLLQGGWRKGDQTYDLPRGSNALRIVSSQVQFDVAENGTVAVTGGNTGMVTANGNTLSLNVTQISIDPGDFSLQWIVDRATGYEIGAKDIFVVEDVTYKILLGVSSAEFTVAANGALSVPNTVSLAVDGNTLNINTVPIHVDSGDFLGDYSIVRALSPGRPEGDVFYLSPNQQYYLTVGYRSRWFFFVDANGNVDLENNGNTSYRSSSPYLDSVGNEIVLGNSLLEVDPGLYAGVYGTDAGLGTFEGPSAMVLIPGGRYALTFGTASFWVDLDEDGLISAISADSNDNSVASVAATGIGSNRLLFNTYKIDVDVESGSDESWSLAYLDLGLVNGDSSVHLVAGLPYYLYTSTYGFGVRGYFELLDPCAPIPSSVQINDVNFNLSCAEVTPPDNDGDGIPDGADNCSFTYNPDQADQDGDEIGDACDQDIDGDNVANGNDNCPLASNPNQNDLDSDGRGDSCDEDIDGDTVNDEFDNCPLTANPGQYDTDGDGYGDACDTDDDNDNILDISDNCPTIGNEDQSDIDSDGEGDACDGDVDGDGVANDHDLCSMTPFGTLTNQEGCNGVQLVSLLCVKEEFGSHGQYVSCVSRVAKEANGAGLINTEEKGRMISQAAKDK